MHEMKTTIIDWETSMFSIFWGLWITKLIDSFLDCNQSIKLLGSINLSTNCIALILVIYVALFSYFYVKTMWTISKRLKTESFSLILSDYKELIILTFIQIATYYSLQICGLILVHQFIYGALITASWVLFVSIVAFRCEGWEV